MEPAAPRPVPPASAVLGCGRGPPYAPRHPEASPLYWVLADHFEALERVHEERFEPTHSPLRAVARRALGRSGGGAGVRPAGAVGPGRCGGSAPGVDGARTLRAARDRASACRRLERAPQPPPTGDRAGLRTAPLAGRAARWVRARRTGGKSGWSAAVSRRRLAGARMCVLIHSPEGQRQRRGSRPSEWFSQRTSGRRVAKSDSSVAVSRALPGGPCLLQQSLELERLGDHRRACATCPTRNARKSSWRTASPGTATCAGSWLSSRATKRSRRAERGARWDRYGITVSFLRARNSPALSR